MAQFYEGRNLAFGFCCLGQETSSSPESQLRFILNTDIRVLNKTFKDVRILCLVDTSLKVCLRVQMWF